MGFDRLHPAVQHHIVNSLGWSALRPLQEQAIDPLIDGDDAILLAPTAGGKTEAAIFPVLSKMLADNWTGLSVLYVCPIKALLNNLHLRLEHYGRLVGRTVELWHGDVEESARRQIRREPPDILLTTPESIEAQLVSRRSDPPSFFGSLRVVIADEVHAFGGDDRGWHLLAVLSRLEHLAGRPLQRIGLSASIGNPRELLAWLSPRGRPGRVIGPATSDSAPAELIVDHVGSIANAAQVISQLHRGRKRVVFCDSRARVEDLASQLRHRDIATFVSHSSLGVEERRDAERAFAEGEDCVIVATSTLELGIDVGDLDHVIQIDAPSTVASFLQRLGRTGRRPGTIRNCLFLATSQEALIRAAALVRLFRAGYVEPVVPPPEPLHVLAQQLMGLVLQTAGLTRRSWLTHLEIFLSQAALAATDGHQLIEAMLDRQILFEDEGVIWFGPEGEQSFGRRHFMELLAVFASPPLLTVLHGRREVGQVHPLSCTAVSSERPISLGGRAWEIVDVDWQKRVVLVRPAPGVGRARWLSDVAPLGFDLCRACREVLTTAESDVGWSTRAQKGIEESRKEHFYLEPQATVVVADRADRSTWWTFGGLLANEQLAGWLRRACSVSARADNMSISIDGMPPTVVADAVGKLDHQPAFSPEGPSRVAERLKFRECLPGPLLDRLLQARYAARHELARIIAEPCRAATIAV